MPQMQNIGEFIRSNYDLAGAPLLALVLLGLEKLMETEFICPSHRVFGIIYSLVFIVGTTAILTVLVNPCWSCHSCRTRQTAGDIEQGAQDPTSHQESRCCKCCTLQDIANLVTRYKAPIFWVLILITDGRYWTCCVESIQGLIMKTTTEEKGFILQIFQVIGLAMILIFVIILLRKCERKSKRYEKKHKDNILQYTQEALQEHKKQRLLAFVNRSMGAEDWDPKLLSAEEEWEEITEKCKKKVINNLQGEEARTRPGGNADMPLSIIDAQSSQ